MKKEITCIVCPQGCELCIEYTKKEITNITGNKCKRGLVYAEEEIFHPMRMVTTTVRINNTTLSLLPVKTSAPVPKQKTNEIVKEAAKLAIKAPVKMGDILIENILDTGVNLVATRSL